jgi:hypothetical protein
MEQGREGSNLQIAESVSTYCRPDWLRELDLNQRPQGYERCELPGCLLRFVVRSIPACSVGNAQRHELDTLLERTGANTLSRYLKRLSFALGVAGNPFRLRSVSKRGKARAMLHGAADNGWEGLKTNGNFLQHNAT